MLQNPQVGNKCLRHGQQKTKNKIEVILGNEHPKLDLAFIDNSF